MRRFPPRRPASGRRRRCAEKRKRVVCAFTGPSSESTATTWRRCEGALLAARKKQAVPLRNRDPDCNFSWGVSVEKRDLVRKSTQSFASSTVGVSKSSSIWTRSCLEEICPKFASDGSQGSRTRRSSGKKQMYPKGVRIRRLLTTVRQG